MQKISINFKNRLFYCFLIFFSVSLSRIQISFSQDLDDDSTVIKRTLYFLNQRASDDSIPYTAYQDALTDRDNLRVSQGLFSSGTSWQPLGPSPGNYTINCPYYNIAGRCETIMIDPKHPGTAYVGSANGGLWKTTNLWTSTNTDVVWTNITWNSPVQSLASGSFVIDPNDTSGNTIYYGTGEGVEFTTNYMGFGIFKTTNAGTNWTKVSSGLPENTRIYKIAIKPQTTYNAATEEVLVALGTTYWLNPFQSNYSGLYRSTNGGSNWAVISSTRGYHCTDVAFNPANSNKVYCIGPPSAGTYLSGTGYRTSTNGGANWSSELNPFSGSNPIHDNSYLSVSATDSNIIYMMTCGGSGMLIYKSTDGGSTFGSSIADLCGAQNYTMFIQVSPWDANLVFASGQDLWRTTNGGTNWTALNQTGCGYCGSGTGVTNVHADVHNFAYYPIIGGSHDANKFLLTCDGGVYRTTNAGSTFENLNKTLNCLTFYRFAADPYNDATRIEHLLGAAQDNGLQNRNAGTNEWNVSSGGDYGNVCYNIVKPDNFIGINLPGGALFTTDNGSNLNSSDFAGIQEHTPFASDPDLPGVFYAGTYMVWRTTNFGSHFARTTPNSDPIDPTTPTPTVTQIGVGNSNIIYASTYHYDYLAQSNNIQHLFLSTNGGASWTNPNDIDVTSFDKRPITSIQVDRADANLNNVIITLAGFGVDHVYKSTNRGSNWSSISGNLPDIPVNDLLVYYNNCATSYIAATDLGVFRTDNGGTTWKELGTGLPNSACTNLQLNRFAQKLRVGTFGVGAWSLDLGATESEIDVKDNLIIGGSTNVDYDIVVCNGGVLTIPAACTISMASGKKITVLDGGKIECSSGNAVTFNSQSGTWDGIEFQNSGYGTLKNCTFNNTISPITAVVTPGAVIFPTINIDTCIFTEGPITITNRNNISVAYCTWNYTSPLDGSLTVCGIDETGSTGISLTHNTINYYASTNSVTGISLVYGSGSLASTNVVTNTSVGIFASNCDADIRYNTIKPTTTTSSVVGIGLFDCSGAVILYDTVLNYDQGINLDGSSPVMHDNVVTDFTATGMYCDNSSNPRMTPTVFGGMTFWDAGLNNFQSSSGTSDGFDIYNSSKPNVLGGYNTIYGRQYYISGDPGSKWDLMYNCWVDNPPNSGMFNITGQTYDYSSYSCTPPGGASGMWGIDNNDLIHLNENIEDPPEPLIVSYTEGIYDTIKTTNSAISVNSDMALYHTATKKALDNDFSGAITSFKQVVSNYKDSTSAIESMKMIFYCHDRLHSDTNSYADLRSYYLNAANGNVTDTPFVKVAQELSRKCIVKKGQYSEAVSEYEDVVENSSDSANIISAQVNIIEIYILALREEGDVSSSPVNGRLSYLKPTSKSNGLAMIKEKLYHLRNVVHTVSIPKVFSLSQNYPNPFNPTTTIKYSIPKDVKVVIKIYDILGREVKTLVNDFKKTGFYEEKFDGSNIASGIYFYKIIAGDFIQSKKMVLVK